MEQHIIQEVMASGEDVWAVVEKIEPLLKGVPRHICVIACLSVAITAQNPDISEQQLCDAVKGASQWVALFLSEQAEPTPPGRMN